jgi:hypothetical protein
MHPHSWQRPQRVGLALTAVAVLAGTVVAYLGTRGDVPTSTATGPSAPAGDAAPEAIALPHAEPDLPPGPHREAFHVACTVCHSTQLVLNQPPFPAKKWEEVVVKMVRTYGAPVGPAQQAEVLEYLSAVRGAR